MKGKGRHNEEWRMEQSSQDAEVFHFLSCIDYIGDGTRELVGYTVLSFSALGQYGVSTPVGMCTYHAHP